MTVKELIEQLKKSQGFVVFASYVVKEGEELKLQHQYIRQQFVPEDLEASFKNFGDMVKKDLVDSGANLIKSAEAIANMKSPTSLTVEDAQIKKVDPPQT